MRNIAIVSVLLLAANLSIAQNEPEDYVKSFFDLVAQGKITEAIASMPANEKFENDTSYMAKLQTKLIELAKTSGEYCGYELIEKEEVSASYVIYSYFIKYLNAPQRIQFIFYKPKESWQINHIGLTNQPRPTQARRNNMRM
jgi:hypothetical protein